MADPDIPAEFHSDYEGRPFCTCTRCGESLTEIPEGYQVFKLYRGGESIYEYALCHPCHLGIVEQMSPESRQRLEDFHTTQVDLTLSRRACAVCRLPEGENPDTEYSITGAFQGRSLIHDLLMCGTCKEAMQALLSEQTRDVWDRFVNDNLPGVPADVLNPADLIPA